MKVAILGTASGWEMAPFEDPSFDIWGLNDLYQQLDPSQLACVRRWFELHPDTESTAARRPANHWKNLAQLGIPVYTFSDVPVPSAVRFPLDLAISAGREYFACTMAYQIALAIAEGADTINLYGIVLCGTLREAVVERPCVEWWLGLAEGRGVSVSVCHPYPYGLGRHRYRYALDDHDERSDVRVYCCAHYDRAFEWLLAEAIRETVVQTRRQMLDAETPAACGPPHVLWSSSLALTDRHCPRKE